MTTFRLALVLCAFTAVAASANPAWALGFELGESKEELKLDYTLEVTDHQTGRVTIQLTIADEGRLKPFSSIDLLVMPKDDKTGYVDLSVSLATRDVDGKRVATVHLARELAERASIQLKTNHFDGKTLALTWYYHSIPLAKHLPKPEQKSP